MFPNVEKTVTGGKRRKSSAKVSITDILGEHRVATQHLKAQAQLAVLASDR